jgi:hypothetical protein
MSLLKDDFLANDEGEFGGDVTFLFDGLLEEKPKHLVKGFHEKQRSSR